MSKLRLVTLEEILAFAETQPPELEVNMNSSKGCVVSHMFRAENPDARFDYATWFGVFCYPSEKLWRVDYRYHDALDSLMKSLEVRGDMLGEKTATYGQVSEEIQTYIDNK